MFSSGLRLVQALQSSVVALVQSPRVDNGHAEIIRLGKHRPCSLNGSPEDRGEHDVKLVSQQLQALACLDSLIHAVRTQVDVSPTSEDVRHIPNTLAMT